MYADFWQSIINQQYFNTGFINLIHVYFHSFNSRKRAYSSKTHGNGLPLLGLKDVMQSPFRDLTRLKATYDIYGSKMSFPIEITAWSKDEPCNLCIVHAQDNIKGNCSLTIDLPL